MPLSRFWIPMLEVAAGGTDLAVAWLVHSTIVLAVGLLTGWLVRGRGPALQSAVYRMTLVGTLACPIVSAIWAHEGISVASFQLPGFEELTVARRPAKLGTNGRIDRTPGEAESPAAQKSVGTSAAQRPHGSVELAGERNVAGSASAGLAIIIMAVLLCWLLGSMMLLARLVAAHCQMVLLRRAAVPVGAGDQHLCKELSGRIGVAPPALLTTPFVAGPCLAGIFRPVILLPEALAAKVPRCVLIHELAHLRRGDCAWNLATKATIAVLFFQPLVWLLSRLLETSSEEVCDDFVVEDGTDRQKYAELLVELAKASVITGARAVVPLIAFRSRLACRVLRIMDRTRRLQLTVGTTVSCAVLGMGLATTLAATAMQLTGRGISTPDKSEVVVADREQAGRLMQAPQPEASAPSAVPQTAVPVAPPTQPSEPEYKVGDRIVVIHQNVPIVVDDKTVDLAYMGWKFDVERIEGSRIWVASKTPGWIERRDTVPYDRALAYFTDFLERHPTDTQAWRAKATLLMYDGAIDAAIAEFTEMLRLYPKSRKIDVVWNDLGRAWLRKGDYDRAIANFDEAIRLGRIYPVYYHNRGDAWTKKGDAANAIKDWKTAVTMRPNFYWSQRQLAWLMATWPEEHFRNGKEAVERATIACEFSQWKDGMDLDILAAAYAECGDFEAAVQWQTKASELLQQDESREEVAVRLALYKEGKPYRESNTSSHTRVAP